MTYIQCLDCYELTDTFRQIDMNPLESVVSYVEKLKDILEVNLRTGVVCSVCKLDLMYEEFYITNENEELFTTEVGKILGEEISRYLPYCSNCEIVKEIEDLNEISTTEIGIRYIEGQNVRSFLEDHFVPNRFQKYVIPYLNCKGCDYGYNKVSNEWSKGKFDNNVNVFTEAEISDYLEIDMEEWSHFAENYEIFIRQFELFNFINSLKKFPMLALNHSVGKKLYDLLLSMYENNDFIKVNKVLLYRGRTRDKGSDKYSVKDMWNPPFGVSSHGRYNIVGTSVLYLTDSQTYIPYEVNFNPTQELDIAKIRITKTLDILDLSNLIGDFGRFLSQDSQRENILKAEYLFTNFISNCCKQIGFHGIKYRGVKKGNYYNYAILNFEPNDDLRIEEVESRTVNIYYK